MASGFLQVNKVTAAMLLVEFMSAANRTINKAAMNRGMSNFIYVLYENILAAIFLLFCSLIVYRKRSLTPPTISVFCRICFLSIISVLTPALASAINILGPAFTFILAIICRYLFFGFYSMLWGQARQHLVVEPDQPTCSSDPSSHEAPLLECKRGQV